MWLELSDAFVLGRLEEKGELEAHTAVVPDAPSKQCHASRVQ